MFTKYIYSCRIATKIMEDMFFRVSYQYGKTSLKLFCVIS